MAEAIGLSYPYLYELETGKKISPTISVLSKIATFYNISLNEIIRLSELEDNNNLDYQQLLYYILEYYVKQKSNNLDSDNDINKMHYKKK